MDGVSSHLPESLPPPFLPLSNPSQTFFSSSSSSEASPTPPSRPPMPDNAFPPVTSHYAAAARLSVSDRKPLLRMDGEKLRVVGRGKEKNRLQLIIQVGLGWKKGTIEYCRGHVKRIDTFPFRNICNEFERKKKVLLKETEGGKREGGCRKEELYPGLHSFLRNFERKKR